MPAMPTRILTKLARRATLGTVCWATVAVLTFSAQAQPGTANWQEAVGRLNLSGFDWQRHCTATLITRRTVLTAAHCLYVDSRNRWAKPSEINFLAGYDRGRYASHLRAERVVRADGVRPNRPLRLADAAMDWAIIVTQKAAPASISPLPVDTEALDAPLLAAGYVRGRAHALSESDHCQILTAGGASRLIAHTCPLGPGASGGPLIALTISGPRVVGIQTGQSDGTGYAIPARTFAPEVVSALDLLGFAGDATQTAVRPAEASQ